MQSSDDSGKSQENLREVSSYTRKPPIHGITLFVPTNNFLLNIIFSLCSTQKYFCFVRIFVFVY